MSLLELALQVLDQAILDGDERVMQVLLQDRRRVERSAPRGKAHAVAATPERGQPRQPAEPDRSATPNCSRADAPTADAAVGVIEITDAARLQAAVADTPVTTVRSGRATGARCRAASLTLRPTKRAMAAGCHARRWSLSIASVARAVNTLHDHPSQPNGP